MSYPLNKVCAVVLLSLAVPAAANAEPCRTRSFSAASYLVCSFDLTRDDLRTYWRRGDGKPYRTFAALAEDLEEKGKSLRFAMNGGMYRSDFRPVGLYIENGRELAPVNTTTLTGTPSQIPNFYKKPNGAMALASSRRAASSPKGQARSTPPSQGQCLSSTGLSILLLSWAQPIASRAVASASSAQPGCTSSSARVGSTFMNLLVSFAMASAVTMPFFSTEA